MINPSKITNFNQTQEELEENILFWILVAGKTANDVAKSLNNLLTEINGLKNPFRALKKIKPQQMPNLLKKHGIGCYNLKAHSIIQIINSNLDLKTCSLKELENIIGIGPKTARCFLIHSRKKANVCGLDTHVLKFLRDLGHKDVPLSTPNGKRYLEWEKVFLSHVKKTNYSVAEFDLKIWNAYSSKSQELIKSLL